MHVSNKHDKTTYRRQKKKQFKTSFSHFGHKSYFIPTKTNFRLLLSSKNIIYCHFARHQMRAHICHCPFSYARRLNHAQNFQDHFTGQDCAATPNRLHLRVTKNCMHSCDLCYFVSLSVLCAALFLLPFAIVFINNSNCTDQMAILLLELIVTV